jgi:outer membrane protein assembly factor BamD (BamD/ComL family)
MGGGYPGPAQSQPGWAGYPGPVSLSVTKGSSGLIRPLPLWAFVTSILVVALLLAVLVFFTGADWSAGAQTAGIVALVVGALILIAFGVRAALGLLAPTNVHRRSQIISALLLAVLLFAVGAIGLTQGAGIHAVQAHFLEGQQKWQLAIDEYQASGQSAPTSDDMARTYVAWGEQLSGRQPPSDQQYSDALGKFAMVITTYTQAPTQIVRAQKDTIATTQAAGTFDSQSKNYAGATRYYDNLLGQAYCTTSCQAQISALDASAYYNLAEQSLAAQKFADAVAAFNTLTTKFGSSPSAQKAHADYAKALWGQGQAQLTTVCSSAVATYQQLATNFSDTSEGQQAATALKQPQPVKGQFTTTIPSGTNTPEVGLVQGISANMSSNAFYAILAKSPVVPVQSDGKFQFRPLTQGTYYLVWGVANSADNQVVFLVGQRYPATVGQLCPFDYGSISENFPTA